MIEVLFWVFVPPAALAALLSIKSGRKYLEYIQGEILGEPDDEDGEPPYAPPLTVILPVRGLDHDLARNLRSLSRQVYPDYEFLVVCRSEDDPAVPVVRMTLGTGCRVIFSGAPPEDTGEKVHNLLAAAAEARPGSQVFVFADSDGQVEPGWLAALVKPLREPGTGAATGFRWYFPDDGGFWPLMRSVWDSAVAGQMSANESRNFAWGGGMAVRRETFEKARVSEYWRGTVSDDYRLTSAMNDAKLGIRYVPGAMVATTGACGRQEFLDWAARQLIITKVYRKGLWVAGFAAHVFYCGAMAASLALAAAGNPLGLGGLIVTTLPGMAKGAMRNYAGRLMFPRREEWFDRHGWAYFWLTPIATWIWLRAFWASAFTRRIRWRGYEYELVSAQRTALVSADESA